MRLGLQGRDRAGGGLPALAVVAHARGGAGRRLKAGAKTAQVGLHRLAVRPDCRLERLRRDRQGVRRRDRAQHDCVDHGARLLGDRLHVEQQMPPRMGLDRLDEPAFVVAAVAHRHPFRDRIGAVGRGDHRGALRGDEAVRDRPAGLHELARHHDVDVAAAGRQGQHRPLVAERGQRHRHDLDVVGGGARALRDARDRRALDRISLQRRRRDDPVGQHAAALAAERGDQHGDRARRRHAVACAAAGVGRPAIGSSRRRRAWRMRSNRLGLATISAR